MYYKGSDIGLWDILYDPFFSPHWQVVMPLWLASSIMRINPKPTPYIWVVVKIMVPFWIPNIVRHLIFTVPQKGP